MSLLSDQEIRGLIEATDSPLLEGHIVPTNWYGDRSLVQPSSLDLHVGNIYVPPKEEPKVGELADNRTKYILNPGQAIIVDTAETLHLPTNIAAFGFPPTSISNRAILMTNPGHIDPGFKGKLNFTLINMGRDPFPINKGVPIVTLLLIKLATPPQKDFSARNPDFAQAAQSPHDLYLIGRDFLDLEERTKKAAENAVRNEDIRIKRMQIWIPVITAILGAVLAFTGAWFQYSQSIADIKKEVDDLKNQIKLEDRFKEIENKINKLLENSNSTNDTKGNQNTAKKPLNKPQ